MFLDLLAAAVILSLVLAVGCRSYSKSAFPIERFTARRQLSWLTLGASLAASAMSADTPLLIAGAVYMDGMAGNWFWWAGAPGCLATLFFFARLWRRSGVLTEVEILRLRYGDCRTVRRYRLFQAILEGLILNALVLASNGYAFTLVLRSMLARWHLTVEFDLAGALMVASFAAAAAYAVIVGFRGLARSDAVGFLAVVVAGVMLAGFVLARLPDGLSTLATRGAARAGQRVFDAWPDKDAFGPLLLLAVGWWHSAPGRGMLIQRVAASRDETSAMKTVGTFAVLHYVVRPWGWYVVGAAALLYLPVGANPDGALPLIAGRILPSGLFGVILAVTTLAFMGCVNSRLNFGASYIVNDVVVPLLPALAPARTRLVEIATVIALTVSAVLIVRVGIVSQIRALYQFLAMMLAGTGFVAITRWYWWRTTIHCEIASLCSAIVVACVAALYSTYHGQPTSLRRWLSIFSSVRRSPSWWP